MFADFSDNIASVTLTGGSLGDVLRGGSGDDTLNGGAGNDTIEGGFGSNQINGGAGVNTVSYANLAVGFGDPFGIFADLDINFVIDARGLVNDTVFNVQNLVGTSIADQLYGTSAANAFEGGGGADLIDGRDGSDTVSYEHSAAGVTVNLATGLNSGGDAEGDLLTSIENITGSRFADSLTGDAGANRIYGFGGQDTLSGGDGNDTYIVRNAGVVVIEVAGQGTDSVQSTVTYTLTDNVERLTLVGNAIDGTGNSTANVITGSAQANVIDGKGGIDVLTGGGGNDTFVFSTAISSTNFDRIVDFNAGDAIRLDSSIFTQFSAGDLPDEFFKNLDLGKQDANDKILYDQDTGRLFYDADGRGGEVAKLFAILNNHADLTAADFKIV